MNYGFAMIVFSFAKYLEQDDCNDKELSQVHRRYIFISWFSTCVTLVKLFRKHPVSTFLFLENGTLAPCIVLQQLYNGEDSAYLRNKFNSVV